MKEKKLYRSRLPLLLGMASFSGCGSGLEQFPMSMVTGSVVCEGKPVPNAMVYFEPVKSAGSEQADVGKQGYALTDSDGKFTVSTYGENDGAVIGKHLVRVGKSETSPACGCALNANVVLTEVDVKAGDAQTFELVLSKKTARNRDEVLEPEED